MGGGDIGIPAANNGLRGGSWSACLSVCPGHADLPCLASEAPAAKALPHRTITRTTPEESTCRLLLTLCSHPELPAQQSFHKHSAHLFAFDIRSTRQHIRPSLALSSALSKPTPPKRLAKRERLPLFPSCIATFVSAPLIPFKETALIWIVILRPTRHLLRHLASSRQPYRSAQQSRNSTE